MKFYQDYLAVNYSIIHSFYLQDKQSIDTIATMWAGTCIRNFFLFQFARMGIFVQIDYSHLTYQAQYLPVVAIYTYHKSSQWTFVWCADSKPSLPFRPEINTFLFPIYACGGLFYGNFLFNSTMRYFTTFFKSSRAIINFYRFFKKNQVN